MRTVIVTNIVSLDGYYSAADGNPLVLNMEDAFNRVNLERIERADLVLLGRASFEFFSPYWPHIADAPDDPSNPALDDTNRAISRVYNTLPKVVVGDGYTVPEDNAWAHQTTVVGRDEVAAWLADAKRGGDGDILIFGSHTMWNGLLEQGLVDELCLIMSPTVLTEGVPLFTTPASLTLLEARTFDGSDNVLLRYAVRR